MSTFWQVLLALIIFVTLPITIPLTLILAGIALVLGVIAAVVGGGFYALFNWPVPTVVVVGGLYLFGLWGQWLEKREKAKIQIPP